MFWKFWGKNKKSKVLKSPESTELSEVETRICHAKYASLDLRRAVLDWRDQHTENVELHLTRELAGLCSALDELADKMSILDLFTQKKYSKKHFEPIYKAWIEREVAHLINAARKDLSAVLTTHTLEFGDQGADLKYEESRRHYTDAAIALAVTGVGLAAIPTVVTISVVPAAGFTSILGATAVALPVVAIGVISISIALAVGANRAFGLKSRAISRYKIAIRKAIKDQVLGKGSEKDSIRQRLQSYIEETARKRIVEIDQC